MSRPLAIIGDIHGDSARVSELIQQTEGRRRVFVGDYVNRGTETRKVLDQLIYLKVQDPESVYLIGNHDAALLAFLDGALPFYRFAGIGGIPTIRSYLTRAYGDVRAELLHVFPGGHYRFLSSCLDYFETPDLLVSHCGMNPDNCAGRERSDMVMARHEGLFARSFRPSKLVVFGHYVQASGSPYVHGNVVCLDTGCGTSGGPLTALLLPERRFLQVH